MGLFSLLRFTSPNASVTVSEAGTDLSTTQALGQAVQNFDTHAANKDTTNTFTAAQTFNSGVTVSGGATINGGLTMDTVLALADGGTGAAALTQHGVVTAGASALTTVAPGASGNVLTSDGTDWKSSASSSGALTTASNVLGADVALNNTATYFDGPSMAQGTSGTWFVSGTVTLVDGANAADFDVKLWDGTTVIASTKVRNPIGTIPVTVTLSGILANPAANIRISAKDITSTGSIAFNASGNSKDSNIWGIKVG